MGSAEPAVGPELSERVEQVRAALPDADRAWFKQELDQALDMTGRPGIWGRSPMSSRAGGGCWLCARMVAGGGRRPRRGYAAVLSPSGKVNRCTRRTRSAAISPKPARCGSDRVSSAAL